MHENGTILFSATAAQRLLCWGSNDVFDPLIVLGEAKDY